MAAQKRALEDTSTSHKSKKSKTVSSKTNYEGPSQSTSTLVSEEVDFPRGGGTSFTPLEVKTLRAEAVKEANQELFEDAQADPQKNKKRKRKSEAQAAGTSGEKADRVRIEHLNYKRMHVGMKIFGQITSIQPLALIISLPNQLFGHVPITNVSSQLTTLLEHAEDKFDEAASNSEEESESQIPELSDSFRIGQYVRAVVVAVHASGSTDMTGIGKSRDEAARASRRVELSLIPERVNAGVQKSDLKPGFTLSAAVQSVEDHGYVLDLGISNVSGFLAFKDGKHGASVAENRFLKGQLLDVTVEKLSSNARTCNVNIDSDKFRSSSLSEVSNVTSVLPGTLVQCLVTAVHSTGLNLQVLGFFDGTIEEMYLRYRTSEKVFQIGQRVKARVLYDLPVTPPRFALSLAEHIVKLDVRRVDDGNSSTGIMQELYPVGRILESVKIARVETERGLVAQVDPGLEGFAHISHVSDDHLPTLTQSGPWKLNSLHRARVIGYFPFDGILQLSLKPSILDQKFFQVCDVHVGAVVKGTIKKLTDSGLYVSLSGSLDGVVWPNHYADIVLKQPSKRFKVGAAIKCRALVVDAERRRVSLTAKKTLVESALPVISAFEEATIGLVTHAVVFKVFDKYLLVEFYNNIKALVPMKEISESPLNLAVSYPVGKVVKVRIVFIEPEQRRLTASIRQASLNIKVFNPDISGVEISNIVAGVVHEIHKDNAVLTLIPTEICALISLNNLANHRGLSLAQLRANLKVGEKLEDLVVVTRNAEKSLVIVANKPKVKATTKNSLTMDTVTIGQIVSGRVTRQLRNGTLIKLTAHIRGLLHTTDISDDFEAGASVPAIDSIVKAAVVGVDRVTKQLTLSTRRSRMAPDQVVDVTDREIGSISDISVGDNIRGFVKRVEEHGVFVTVGRDIDARVQIRELFDDYVKEWKDRFQVNQIVKGRVLSVDADTRKVEMSFRSSDLPRASSSSITLRDLQKGQKVEGTVKRIEDYGLFIQISGSKLSGLCHKSELSDTAGADVAVALRGFRDGDKVKAVVLDIDQRRISLSMKPSHFDEEDFEDQESDDQSEALGVVDDGDPEDDAVSATGSVIEEMSDDEEEDEEMQVDFEPESHLYTPNGAVDDSTTAPHTSSLQISGGFKWSDVNVQQSKADDESDSSSNEEDDEEQHGRKKRRKRKEIEQDLTADMHTKTPESNADFERLLLGSPNSSYLWIQYMSFQLQLSEVDKAREIARRALQTIHFREEQEKLNVWIALLNLECAYGTDETLESTFKEAARANDSKTVHLRLALIFNQAGKHQNAEEQYKRTCKKFGQSSKVWTLFSEHHLQQGNIEESRKLLPRSLQSLDKRKHLKTISRFAQLEYKYGEPERGKTLFEGIVDSHPKRWDLWSVYMDMEASQGNIQSLRNIFNRVLTVKMTSHKAKSFFKKWLELEKRIGDEEGTSMVKQKAVEWTQQVNSS